MISMSVQQLATVVSGQLMNGPAKACRLEQVSTDSRNCGAGALFIALCGERFDGHDYVAQAIASGAEALLVSRAVAADIPQILVTDTLLALGQLGQWVKAQSQLSAVAITGSSGKTTVKELVAAILAQQSNVLATHGNFNNEIGVPLTLLRLTPAVDYGVIELGANHLGEIGYTSALVQPDVALITNIGVAHLEGFGSEQGIATAKSEIFSGLKPGGTAIYEASNPYCSQWQALLADKQVLTWSIDSSCDADVKASAITSELNGCHFTLEAQGQSVAVQLPMPGLHSVKNALAASAACLALGVELKVIAQGLSAGVAIAGRLEHHQLTPKLLVIDDSYNANLSSVKAAIDVLSASTDVASGLIFGDMGELGEYSESHHTQVGEYAQQQGVQALFTLGHASALRQQAFAGEGAHYTDLNVLMQQLTCWILEQQQPVRLLIKGSRSAAMERVLTELTLWQKNKKEQPC